MVTGDIHHYARYVPDDDGPYRDYGPYLVTCGGGGAFLSSTHHLSENLTPVWRPWEEGSPTTTYRRVREYPSKQQSKDLLKSPRFLRAALRNGLGFPALVGLIDLALLFSLETRGKELAPQLTLVEHAGNTQRGIELPQPSHCLMCLLRPSGHCVACGGLA